MTRVQNLCGIGIALALAACGDDGGSGGGGTGGETTSSTTGGTTSSSTTTSSTGGVGGGPECMTAADCDDGDACTVDACNDGTCATTPVDPDDNDACTTDTCDPVGGVSNTPVDPNDNNACTTDSCDSATGVINAPIDRNDMDACTFDSCDPAVGPVNQDEVVFFTETFANNNAGWTLGTDWQIGAAVASPPGERGSADPAQDHTQLGDNGIAGVVIGGNVPVVIDGVMAYLESPAFDTTGVPSGGSLELRLWRWMNADYTPYMTNTIEVYDGTQWVTLWTTQGNDDVIIDSDVPGYGDGWYPMSFDVTAYSNAAFRVRFGSDVGDAEVYAIGGANYDDITVVSVPYATDADQCTVAACDSVNGASFAAYVPATDGVACTQDVCDSTYGVKHEPDNTACNDSNACTNDYCDVELGCQTAPVSCDDANLCTTESCDTALGCQYANVDPNDNNVCTADSCNPGTGVVNTPIGFRETFLNNNAGWTLDTNWAVGSAVAGCGDPGTDHTPSADNGIAGVVLGGCAPTSPVDAALFYCATSPVVDTTSIASPTLSYWRDLYSDYTPYMKNKVEVWNGSAWVILWETFGSPGVNDASWTFHSHDLSPHSNANLRVRFCYNIGSSGAFNRGSWNLDDVAITPPGCGL